MMLPRRAGQTGTGKETLTPGWVNIRRTLPMPLCRVRFSTPTGGSSTYTYTYSHTVTLASQITPTATPI
jgi:hypothetical protein